MWLLLYLIVATQVTAEVMDRLPQLGLIATRSTGTDHIDTAEAARRGITIANVPDYGSVAVAEHTFQDQDLRILGAIGPGEQG